MAVARQMEELLRIFSPCAGCSLSSGGDETVGVEVLSLGVKISSYRRSDVWASGLRELMDAGDCVCMNI